MLDTDDMALLREFARDNSETAFAELVQRHLNLVYSVALRYTASPGDAQDVAQAVFIILARKAARLHDRTVLTGWLYETTRLTAAGWLRTQKRRQAREQEAYMQSTLDQAGTDNLWRQLAPHLEAAMSRLNAGERTLLALRFYENKTGAEAAALLGIREEAAHKRTARALEKLRQLFVKRGINSTTAILAEAISANSLQAAPVGLAVKISAVAMAKGAAAETSTLTLVKGALKLMVLAKTKTAIVIAVGILLAAGTTTITIKEIQKHKTQSWQMMKDFRPPWSFEQMPQQVEILPTRFQQQKYSGPRANETVSDGRFIGINQSIQAVIECTFHVQHPDRVLYPVELPTDKYDFIATLKRGSGDAMQQKLKDKFGLIGRLELVETNVLVLKIKYPDALKLKPSTAKFGSTQIGNGNGGISSIDGTMDDLVNNLEDHFKIPIINQTGLMNNFDFEISWDDYQGGYPNLNGLKQALPNQLGLELLPTNMPIEMLVVEKAK